jgi:hypothetical protein
MLWYSADTAVVLLFGEKCVVERRHDSGAVVWWKVTVVQCRHDSGAVVW